MSKTLYLRDGVIRVLGEDSVCHYFFHMARTVCMCMVTLCSRMHTHTHSHTHSRLGTDRGIASSGSGLRPFWDISAEEGKKDEAAT